MSIPTPPDLVIFDVDGTLHDAFRWWARVIRSGVRAFADRAGIEPVAFTDAEAEAVVGMKDAGVWAPFLPDEHKHRWPDLRSVVLPMEIDELRSGADHLFDGVRELLAALRAHGIPLALASNCRQLYLDAMCAGQGLGDATDWQFCLDSPGVGDKTGMLRAAVAAAGARRPVMIGDREPDLEAARAAGQPFVWRANGRCDLAAASDLVWTGAPDELLGAFGLPGIS